MAYSYFELGSQPLPAQQVQQATVDALQHQQDKSLAVLPSVSLAGPIKEAMARRAAQTQLAFAGKQLELRGQELDIARERQGFQFQAQDIRAQEEALRGYKTRLAEKQYGYEQRMLPWGVGLSALGAGLNIYSGYRGLQDTEQARLRAAETAERMAGMEAASAVNTKRQIGLYDALQAALNRQVQPYASP